MDLGNIDTNTGVGKVIAFLVAFIIVALVAVPIVNSISDGQSGSGDSGDDSGPITYTNTGDYYYKPTADDEAVHTFVIESPNIATSETTGTFTTILKEDGVILDTYNGWWNDDTDMTSIPSTPFVFGWNNTHKLLFDMNYMNIIESSSANLLLDGIKENETEISETEHIFGVSFTVQNGVVSYVNYEDEQVTLDITLDYLISADGTGEYVHAQTPFKTATNTTIIVCEGVTIEDAEHNMTWGTVIAGDINTTDLTSSSVSIDLTATDMGAHVNSIDSTITSTNDNGLITVSKIESDVELAIYLREGAYYVSDTVSLGAVVPTTVTIDPSAVEITVTNSGQTYKELDDNSHNIHTETTTNGGITTVTVFSDDVEIMSFNRTNGDFTPKICLAFGSEGSVWLTNGNTLLMINSDGGVVNMSTGSTYMSIINKTYDSHTYGTVNLEYFISNEGEYVYSDTAMASKTGQIFNIGISLCNVGDVYPIFTSVQSNGTPVSALNNVQIHGYNATIVNSTAHYTDGNYVKLDGLDVTYSFTYDETDYTVDYSTNGFFVPKTFTYTESPDSGSGSGSDSGFVTSTIIKLIPIFLFLGLIIAFVVPMVQSRLD